MRAKRFDFAGGGGRLRAERRDSRIRGRKPGKPLNIKPTISDPRSDDWRERAMRARAEFAPDGAPVRGRTRAVNERGDLADGDEPGAGALGLDRGEGGKEE